MHMSIFHSAPARLAGKILGGFIAIVAVVYVFAGLQSAVTVGNSVAVIGGVSTGVAIGSIPVAVDAMQQGRAAAGVGGSDASLFGQGVQPPAPPAPGLPTAPPGPPAVAAPAPQPLP